MCCLIGSFTGIECDIHVQLRSQCIQQSINQFSSTKRYSLLWWTAINLNLQQIIIHFYSSDVGLPFRSQVQFVSFGCFLRVFSGEWWRRLMIRRICLSSDWGSLILSFDRVTRRILPMPKVKLHIKQSILQAVYPVSFTCPALCNFKYQAIYRSRSLSRYCS